MRYTYTVIQRKRRCNLCSISYIRCHDILRLKIIKLWPPSALKTLWLAVIITFIIAAGGASAITGADGPSAINDANGPSTISATGRLPAGESPTVILSSQENSYLQKLSKTHNPEACFSVKLWIAGQPKIINLGDKINFFFQTPRDCYLTLLDMATNGAITILFPNKFHPNNLVKAGKQYAIPGDYNFEMSVSGPTGIERVKAIATLQPARLFNINLTRGPFDSMPLNDDRAVRGVGGLKTKLEKQDWAETEISFEIQKKP